MLHKKTSIAILTLANVALLSSLLVFAAGFFPHKAFLPGLAQWCPEDGTAAQDAPFDKVIFMIVDALRSDFVFGKDSHFNFTQSLIETGAAVPFTGHAGAPTITMPRVKGITTGSLPAFLDLVLNFAESDTSSTLATQDTWLAQIRAKPGVGKLVFYGDDTWLKLFPGFFERSDGTSSFFVSDFTEVDNNVTRHISDELRQSDWDGMILHFLGLDHIGHKTGPRGPNMLGKQKEMDGIVEQIYRAMETESHLQSCLLVLCGDHGMNEAGNHGGSSPGETSTALVFLSPKFKDHFLGVENPKELADDFRYHEYVQQSDIAPTLAALLGLPIPLNNLGAVMPKFLRMWENESSRVNLLSNNVKQLLAVTQATFPTLSLSPQYTNHFMTFCEGREVSDIDDLICSNLRLEAYLDQLAAGQIDTDAVLSHATSVLRKAQEIMSGAATNYELNKMYTGVGLATIGTICAIITSFPTLSTLSPSPIMLILSALLHAILNYASSYVEEEQQFWYWITSAWLLVLYWTRSQSSKSQMGDFSTLAIMILFRFARRWNQTGQKYAGEPDIATTFFRQHPWILWSLITATYGFIGLRLCRRAASWGSSESLMGLPIPICNLAFLFKLCFTFADAPELLEDVWILKPLTAVMDHLTLTTLARMTFAGLLILLLCTFIFGKPAAQKSSTDSKLFAFHDILTLFLITQSRATNIPLFLIFSLIVELLLPLLTSSSSSPFTPLTIFTTTHLLSSSSFFTLGNSNSISSIDLSSAYNGVASYNVLAVGLLTFISNWSGPIWWISASALLLSRFHPSPTQSTTPTTDNSTIIEKSSSTTSAPQPTSSLSSPTSQPPSAPPDLPPQPPAISIFALQTLLISTSTTSVMLSCLILREHLFIWTVFSPKYLYVVAWVLGWHFGICGILAGILTWF